MLGELFKELENLLWGLGVISAAILILLILPKNISLKLGQKPGILAIMFVGILFLLISIFN